MKNHPKVVDFLVLQKKRGVKTPPTKRFELF